MHKAIQDVRAYLPMLLCPLVLVFCVALARPQAEMGMYDDWSYIMSAKVLAATGHITYNGWATAMLGWQLYWGALFIKLFGWSFGAARLSTLIVSMASLAVMQRLCVRIGLTESNSVLTALTFGMSPLFFLLTFTFMSDVPGMFAILICCYACVRAVQSSSERHALLWLAAAAVSNVVGGTARQVAWLGALAVVPGAAWILRRSRRLAVGAVLLWIASAVSIAGCMYWFRFRPYAITEPLLPMSVDLRMLGAVLDDGAHSLLTLALWGSPVLIACVRPGKSRNAALLGAALIGLSLATIGALAYYHRAGHWLAPFTSDALGFADSPTILGERPTYASLLPRIVLTAIIAALLICAGVQLWPAPTRPDITEAAIPIKEVSWRNLLILFGPFLLGYTALFLTRAVRWDRYLLPVFFAAMVVFVKLYQERVSKRLTAASPVALVLAMIFAVASLHDVSAFFRARIMAADELKAAGVAPTQFSAGYEYDGWTQIEATGYVNDARLRVPANAFQPWVPPADVPPDCVSWFASHAPAIHPRYALAYQLLPCLRSTTLQPVIYKTWLPFRTNTLVIGEIR